MKKKKKQELERIKRIVKKKLERSVKGTKMSGRTQTDRFPQLLPRLKRSKRNKSQEVCQRGSTVNAKSGYGTNIL